MLGALLVLSGGLEANGARDPGPMGKRTAVFGLPGAPVGFAANGAVGAAVFLGLRKAETAALLR